MGFSYVVRRNGEMIYIPDFETFTMQNGMLIIFGKRYEMGFSLSDILYYKLRTPTSE